MEVLSYNSRLGLNPHKSSRSTQHITASICGRIYARVCCILLCVYDVVVVKTRKESSRSLSHLLVSFLYQYCMSIVYRVAQK